MTLYTDPKDKQVIKVMNDDAQIINDSGQWAEAIILRGYYAKVHRSK